MEIPGEMAAETRTEGLRAGCPMAAFLETLTRPWTLHILWLLSTNGPMRFGALRRSAEGISARVLTVRLRTLERDGFVTRTERPGKVPEVTYAPTPRLEDMNGFMEQLHRLGDKWEREDVGVALMRSRLQHELADGAMAVEKA